MDWIERLFRISPDAGNGYFEWMTVLFMALLVAAAVWRIRRSAFASPARLLPAGRLANKVRVETFLAAIFGVLAVVTMLWPTWIESITGLEPDAGSGIGEWAVVVVCAVAAIGAAALARRDYGNLKAAR